MTVQPQDQDPDQTPEESMIEELELPIDPNATPSERFVAVQRKREIQRLQVIEPVQQQIELQLREAGASD